MTLSDRVRARLALQPCEISKTNNQYKHGKRAENSRNAKLFDALCGAVETIQNLLDEGNMAAQGNWDATEMMKSMAYARLLKIESALEVEGE